VIGKYFLHDLSGLTIFKITTFARLSALDQRVKIIDKNQTADCLYF